ncbi:MAG: hypothetical protein M1824_004576 [Vezdaea acicularis]|nr:MAG: hypothetical protein M1824_004576 [Vezdaea acicularis]
MAPATIQSLPDLLDSLRESLESAAASLPDSSKILPPKDGISLLDTKNELLLSYLQNLVFLIILKLRNAASSNRDEEEASKLDDQVVRKLVELRIYLERGVRPMEGRLKYQIDKVLHAADDASRSQKQQEKPTSTNGRPKKLHESGDSSDGSGPSDADDDEAATSNTTPQIDELSYRPNPSALQRRQPTSSSTVPTNPTNKSSTSAIYKPPRITPVSLPTTNPSKPSTRRPPPTSRTLDEYITTELSSAPTPLPSIGSLITASGRRTKSAREQLAEQERKTYEESNFVRLPKESRAERKRSAGGERGGRGRDAMGGYGGEEWRGLGEGVERIERLTRRKGGGGVGGLLERSRKRGMSDGPRGGEERVGDRMEKKRRVLSGRNRKGGG